MNDHKGTIHKRRRPIFPFRSGTETHIGRYFRADTVTDTETRFQGKNPVTNFFFQAYKNLYLPNKWENMTKN